MARLEVDGQQVIGVVEEAASVVARLRARLVSSGWQAADIDLFIADFANNAEALAKFDNGALDPKTWFFLKERPDWVKKNLNLHEKLKGESDDFLQKVNDFYATTIKNNTPVGFNGAGRYTNGVYFNEFGFPDFREFNPIGESYVFKEAVGNRGSDFANAKKWMQDKLEIEDYLDLSNDQKGGSPFKVKINGKWSEQMTWHHHENGKDLIPVLSNIHNTTKHVGGVKIVELGLTKITN